MSSTEFPGTIDDVTSGWLTQILVASPNWAGGSIKVVAVTEVGGGDALASSVWRAEVDSEFAGRLSLLIKLHRIDVDQVTHDGYAAEALFYNEIASNAGVTIPETYLADWDNESKRFVVIQEFLSDGIVGTESTPITLTMAENVLSSLARMHARWWNSSALAQFDGIRNANDQAAVIMDRLVDPDRDEIGKFLSVFEESVNPVLGNYYQSMPLWYPKIIGLFSGNFTFTHYDCSAKNLFFPNDPRLDPVFFDWGFSRIGPPMTDVAMCCISLSLADQSSTSDLVKLYFDQLIAEGISNYSFEEAWSDFQLACLRKSYGSIVNTVKGLEDEAEIKRLEHARHLQTFQEGLVIASGAHELILNFQ